MLNFGELNTRIFISLFILLSSFCFGQKVGLVLSGGGANGLAHIGVIKALEEKNIPIDYIAGTSSGALIGGMYASGYSIEEIQAIVLSETFARMSRGDLDESDIYYFHKTEENASWITLKLSKDKSFQSSLPTNLIKPAAVDLSLMQLFSTPAQASGYSFDSLFIPYRCVAADIETKEQVVFKNGNLNSAIRASMSYPFYLSPITVNGKLLFDGGLYNNFPADVMYDEFIPDIIIGSNVSDNFESPDEDDVLSQIKNMLVAKTKYEIPCDNSIIITPKVNNSTFDFSDVKPTIDEGYQETMRRMYEIQTVINRRITKTELQQKRAAFNSQKIPLEFVDFTFNGLNKRQTKFVRKNLFTGKKKERYSPADLKKGYFRLVQNEKIRSLYPTAVYSKEKNGYNLNFDMKREKDITLDFGGNFSSRPINQAYIGIRYHYLGKRAITLSANSYFGKLYGSVQAGIRYDSHLLIPISLEAEYTLNRWDFFKSYATFFEEVQPSFIVQHENYETIKLGIPINNKTRFKTGVTFFQLKDDYYQVPIFTSADTTDVTYFDGYSNFAELQSGALNRKQYASSGRLLNIKASLVNGKEYQVPGSTSEQKIPYSKVHQYAQFKLNYEAYYKTSGVLKHGILFEGYYSTQGFFRNYTSNILRAAAFQPNPESKTFFLESFRANQYVGIGHTSIFNPFLNFEWRLSAYLFQPIKEITLNNQTNEIEYGPLLNKRYTIVSSALVYHTPIGPISLGLNYYHNTPEVTLQDSPISFLFHFGYILFNKKALD